MNLLYTLGIFLITLLAAWPTWRKKGQLSSSNFSFILAFSGAFLISVTLLHLLPEMVLEKGESAGLWMLVGFLFQLALQKFTHGAEHGHVHHHDGHKMNVLPIFVGMFVHALMEGIPLGFNYRAHQTEPSLYLAVGAHKIPESIIIASLAVASFGRNSKSLMVIIGFALCTPLASVLSNYFSIRFYAVSNIVTYIIPIVAGAFLHIATTILFESGTKHHQLSSRKLLAIVFGVVVGLILSFVGHTH